MKNRVLLILCSILFLFSCSTAEVNERITDIELAVDCGDYSNAKSASDELEQDSIIGVNALCRMSIIYMKLAELSDEEENTATAIQCYRSAMKTNSDSAQNYYSSLSVDDAQYIAVIYTLVNSIDNPQEIIVEEADTTTIVL